MGGRAEGRGAATAVSGPGGVDGGEGGGEGSGSSSECPGG